MREILISLNDVMVWLSSTSEHGCVPGQIVFTFCKRFGTIDSTKKVSLLYKPIATV